MSNPIKLKANVTSIIPHGIGIYEVKFKPQNALPRFKAGQFLHLTVDDYDPAGGFWPDSRVFSIASAPGVQELKIFYSVKGRYTRRMEEVLQPGMEVWLKLPYGNFFIDSSAALRQDLVLVAGGTGISPFLPYLRKLIDTGVIVSQVHLHYGIRDNDALLEGEFLDQSCRTGLFKIFLSVENEEPNDYLFAATERVRGRLDIDAIYRKSSDLQNPVFFLSGPPVMISAFESRLGSLNVNPDRIRIDEWE